VLKRRKSLRLMIKIAFQRMSKEKEKKKLRSLRSERLTQKLLTL
jgi:hypothetical protein